MLAALFVALFVPGIASAQTALWLSVTGPQSGSTYYVGDSFSLTITGAPYAAVTVATPGSTPYLYGYTDWSGTWAVNGYWPAQYAGCYTQTWAVAGVAAPTLSFCVQPLPSPTLSLSVNGPQSGSTYYVGDSFTLNVSGAPNAPVTVAGPGGTPYTFGYTDGNGNWSVSGSWSPANIGCFTQYWSVAGMPAPPLSFCVLAPPPSISGISPASAALATPVTITGANFGATQGTSTVTFNGTAATPTSWSATSIVVPVPAGATTGNVVVTVAGVASNGVVFTIPPPNILGFSLGQPVQCPASSCVASLSGPPLMGFVINGTNFGAAQGASTATFNGTALPVVANGWTATSITVQVPAAAVIGTNGNVKVTVGNQDSNQMPFAVTKALTCPQQP